MNLIQRPRRNRASDSLRSILTETQLSPQDFVLPLFVKDGGKGIQEAIPSMPGVFRKSPDLICEDLKEIWNLGIKAIALFPAIDARLKNSTAQEALNKNGLIPETIKRIKDKIPELIVISDVALDPYSSDGHDGLVKDGKILNDETLPLLSEMALIQAQAGADLVAPSDMMDGRVGAIRKFLDENSFSHTGILSYAVKYASSFYGPFREALDSAPKFGDKKTYQLNPANRREAMREVLLDISEGADILMVKPALSYLDILFEVKQNTHLPVAAYNVSGEYSMIKAAAQMNWVDENKIILETLLSMKRAGADMIFTYFALDAARLLRNV